MPERGDMTSDCGEGGCRGDRSSWGDGGLCGKGLTVKILAAGSTHRIF